MTTPVLETRFETFKNGLRVRTARLGGGPALILLHGYPENLQVFCNIAPLLAVSHEVIAFDWPGMGDSDEWHGGATPLIMARRLAELMDFWNIGRATLVAQDMGGQPALVFAALYPDRVSSLVIMNSLVAGGSETSWEIRWLRQFGINRLLLRHFGRLIFHRAIHTFLPVAFTLDRNLKNEMWRTFRKSYVRKFIVRMCAGYEAQMQRLPTYYHQVKCPVLILWAEFDKHFPPAQALSLQQYIQHAEVDILPGATHWMVVAQPVPVADAISRFLSKHQ